MPTYLKKELFAMKTNLSKIFIWIISILGAFYFLIYQSIYMAMFISSPLGFASLFGWKGAVKFFIKCGADVNSNRMIETLDRPLHAAVYKDYIEIVDILIKNRANINATGDEKATPLHKAATYNRKENYVSPYKTWCPMLIKFNMIKDHLCI